MCGIYKLLFCDFGRFPASLLRRPFFASTLLEQVRYCSQLWKGCCLSLSHNARIAPSLAPLRSPTTVLRSNLLENRLEIPRNQFLEVTLI